MTIKHPDRLWLVALFIGWCFDQLFWGVSAGISFFLFSVIVVVAGLGLAKGEGLLPARRSLWLLLPLLFFSAMTAIRQEPFSLALNVMLTLCIMMLAALTMRSGLWPFYSLSDYVAGYFSLIVSALIRPLKFIFERIQLAAKPKPVDAGSESQPTRRPNPLWSVLRGVLLAIPVLLVMGALLASADPIFSSKLAGVLNWIKPNNLAELIFRAFYISFIAFILLGVYLHALDTNHESKLIGIDKPWMPALMNWTEAAIILGSVDLLFAFFVSIQFQYFFGGQANIKVEGFTYAEYARRGFTELVIVAVLSLLLFLGLNTLTRRQTAGQRRGFSGLGIGLVALVAIILVSAYQRLVLYEQAYGFSRLRAYTHVFMIWLGILLVITIVLEVVQHMRTFALALAMIAICFGLTTNLLNIDGFTVRQNVAHAVQCSKIVGSGSSSNQSCLNRADHPLDTAYLVSLSDDAVPALVDSYNMNSLPANIHNDLGATLACRAAIQADNRAKSTGLNQNAWQSFHFATYRADSLMKQVAPALQTYSVQKTDQSVWIVTFNGQKRDCQNDAPID